MASNNIYMRYPGGVAKALTLSYDDGVQQDKRLVDIINAHGLKCTFNINSGCYAEEGTEYPEGTIHRRMTRRECLELYKNSGHEVAVHSLTHPFLEKLSPARVSYEVLKDRENLEKEFGGIVRGMAYPMGTFSDDVVEAIKNCGIAYSRTTVSTERFSVPTDWLRMPATCHHRNPRLMELAQKFTEAKMQKKHPTLFYLWGHSYEFEDNNNWNIIEEFAEYMGGRDDIWYATNIEIYEYVEAYRSLVFSADGGVIMNPTATTLYFEHDFKLRVIAPGETVTL